jgi:hypothetical protein
MSRWSFIPERIWVGAGALMFALVLVWKGLATERLLALSSGIVFAICGGLILLGWIRPPKSNEKL